MPLKVIHDTVDEIPEPFRELYSEEDGKFVLTGIEGIKTQKDVDALTRAADLERKNHKETKEKLSVWKDMNHGDVTKNLDRIKELEIAAAGKIDDQDKHLEKLVEARIHSRIAPVERERETLATENKDLKDQISGHVKKQNRRTIDDHMQTACTKSKVRLGNIPDALMFANSVMGIGDDGKPVTKENQLGIPQGLSPDMLLNEIAAKRERDWWPESKGGGAGGSGGGGGIIGSNPWTADGWNLTEQGKVLKGQGRDAAERLAKAAGTKVGGRRPEKK